MCVIVPAGQIERDAVVQLIAQSISATGNELLVDHLFNSYLLQVVWTIHQSHMK